MKSVILFTLLQILFG